MSNLLEKYYRDLTAEDEDILKKALGVKGDPWPMKEIRISDVGGGDKRIIVDELVALEDNNNPMSVWSDLTDAEVQGIAFRNMPVPSMLRIMQQALKRADPHNRVRVCYMVGEPGVGKTHQAEFTSRMQSKKGALKIDCTGLNAMELFWETVLDFTSDKTFYSELDKRLAGRRLNERSIETLRKSLGDAFQDVDGKMTVDWKRVGHSLPDHDETGAPIIVDGKPVYVDSKVASEIARNALMEVRDMEGLAAFGGNALGLKTQKGPAIRCYEEGRPIILDEINRLKPGTMGILHGFMQFNIGEIDKCTVTNSLKDKDDSATHSFTFDEYNRRLGYFVWMSGNTRADGMEVNELSQALTSRIQPITIPKLTLEDWEHRIGQLYTGVPISTPYRMAEKQWERNPDDFRAYLLAKRLLAEDKPVRDTQLRLLRRWEDVKEAAERLAKFYFMCNQSLDPSSEMHRVNALPSVMAEINDGELFRDLSVDTRRIMTDLMDASAIDPATTPLAESGGVNLKMIGKRPILNRDKVKADPAAVLGTNLTKVLLARLLRDTEGRPALRTQWLQFATDCGLIRPKLHEGKLSGRRTLAELLDENPYDSRILNVQAEYIQSLACRYLRNRYPDLSRDNNDLVSLEAIRRIMDVMDGPAEDDENEIVLAFNDDPSDGRPFAEAYDFDPTPAAGETADAAGSVPEAGTVIGADALIGTLAAPALRQQNLTSIFNRAISRSGMVSETENTKDESLAIAENTSPIGLAVTTLMMKGGVGGVRGKDLVPLHVIWNKQADRVMIVGEGEACPVLKEAFRASRLFYVDRTAPEPEANAKRALIQVLHGEAGKVEAALKDAFLLRNTMPDQGMESSMTLGALLVHKDLKCFLPHYVVKQAPEISRI